MRTVTAGRCWIMALGMVALAAGCHSEKNEPSALQPPTPAPYQSKHVPAVTFVEYVPTPNDVVDRMLFLAKITSDDLLYDLGCGDGRILVAAAKNYGCRAKGCDLDPLRIEESRKNAAKNGVSNLVTATLEDLAKMDLSEATVVTLYLSPEVNASLLPHFKQLKPGSRIVSHNFPIPGVQHEKKIRLISEEDKDMHLIYVYRCPLKETVRVD